MMGDREGESFPGMAGVSYSIQQSVLIGVMTCSLWEGEAAWPLWMMMMMMVMMRALGIKAKVHKTKS